MFKFGNSISICKKMFPDKIWRLAGLTNIPSVNFSKKFYEKRAKLKNYLSKEKEQYKSTLYQKRTVQDAYDNDSSIDASIPLLKNFDLIKEKIIESQKGKNKEYNSQSEVEDKKCSNKDTKSKKNLRTNKLVKNSINFEKNHSYIFFNEKIRRLLIQNYSIIPNFFSQSIINKFTTELKTNPNYTNYLIDWERKSENEKDLIIKEEHIRQFELDMREYKYFKPLLDLFIYFIHSNYSKDMESLKFLSSLSDMTMPHNWYPQARKHRRKIYFHMGPTNSGKTHSALQRLMNAKTGIYCAPLRLLAWEIYDKLTKNDIKCVLKTGQEIIEVENSTHFACTVEICPLTVHYDCAIIDEIQLIADDCRGSAWTNAFLGLKADEIHLCGDERSLNLIYNMCLLTGDKLIKKSYTRLSDLVVEEENIHSVSQLKKGDCIITFSKKEIFKLQNLINERMHMPKDITVYDTQNKRKKLFKNKCAVIYGSLPPETKKIQAHMFNKNEDGIKFLVATDAIGLGLNLKINRVIFSQIHKRDHNGMRKLNEYEIKQIAGRAGRSDNSGFVSAFKQQDLEFIRGCCAKTKHKKESRNIQEVNIYDGKDEEDEDATDNEEIVDDDVEEFNNKEKKTNYNFLPNENLIKKACLFPPLTVIEEFADSFLKYNVNSEGKNTNSNSNSNKNNKKIKYASLSEILLQFENIGKLSDLYFMKNLSELLKVHKIIEDVEDADIRTQYYFTICPIRVTPNSSQYLKFYLMQFIQKGIVKLPQDYHLDNKNFIKTVYKFSDLQAFEEVYNTLEIYIWLSYKFEKEFIERELAKVMKDRVSKIIDSILQNLKFNVYSDLRKESIETSDEEEEKSTKDRKLIEEKNSCSQNLNLDSKANEDESCINE